MTIQQTSAELLRKGYRSPHLHRQTADVSFFSSLLPDS